MSTVKYSKCNLCGKVTEDKTKKTDWISFLGCIVIEKTTHTISENVQIPQDANKPVADFCNVECLVEFIRRIGEGKGNYYKTSVEHTE